MSRATAEALKSEDNLSPSVGYEELTSWMFNLERFGIKLGLDNVSEFLSRIGDPHLGLRAVHVTGTNGKGSVCAMVASILKAAGLRVGLYTSPHLVDFRERISISGIEISENDVVRLAEELRPEMEAMAYGSREKQLTFFEFTTALAFKYFAEKNVDIVVAEVGMGGRLDATNVLRPDVGVITRIGLEHTNYLGKTIPDIAREKAGIVKAGMEIITCEGRPDALSVIESACRRKGAPLRVFGRDFRAFGTAISLDGTVFHYEGNEELSGLRTRLIGRHQAENAAAAVAAIEGLRRKGFEVGSEAIYRGLDSAIWPGRLDVVSRAPLLILDGGHNPSGVETAASVLHELRLTPLRYVVGCMEDKDATGIIKALAPTAASLYVTQVSNRRALAVDKLAEIAKREFDGDVSIHNKASEAIEAALKGTGGNGVCVIGSLYLVGEAISWLRTKGNLHGLSHKL